MYLPLPSIGRTNSHIDICSDLIDASFVAEALAKHANMAPAEHDYPDQYSTRIKLALKGIKQSIHDILVDCWLVFHGSDENDGFKDKFQDIREQICDYEDEIGDYNPKVPQILEWYLANLINGAYYEMRSEAPDYYREQIRKHPERQLNFHRSPFSKQLGAECYGVPKTVGCYPMK